MLIAMLLAAGQPAAAEQPKLQCEWIHEMGSLRPRRVCQKLQEVGSNERGRRAAAQKLRDQNDRDQQLSREEFGPKPL